MKREVRTSCLWPLALFWGSVNFTATMFPAEGTTSHLENNPTQEPPCNASQMLSGCSFNRCSLGGALVGLHNSFQSVFVSKLQNPRTSAEQTQVGNEQKRAENHLKVQWLSRPTQSCCGPLPQPAWGQRSLQHSPPPQQRGRHYPDKEGLAAGHRLHLLVCSRTGGGARPSGTHPGTLDTGGPILGHSLKSSCEAV